MKHSKTYFLTSCPTMEKDGEPVLNPAFGFTDILREVLPERCRFLFIASDPDNPEMAERYADEVTDAFHNSGFDFTDYALLDSRNAYRAAELVRKSGLIFLAGGHVPTEQAFFERIGLRRLLRSYRGVVMGASAGSMNCAETVYACPEYADEVTDPTYVRALKGLDLTSTMIMPHFAELFEESRAGLKVLDDIVLPDSRRRTFIGLFDGSFIFGHDGVEDICGDAFFISNGRMYPIIDWLIPRPPISGGRFSGLQQKNEII